MSVWFRWGLMGRSIALCVMLLLTTAAALTGALIWEFHRDSLRWLTATAVVHARAVARMAEPALLLNDAVAVQKVVGAAAEDHTIERVVILGLGGETIGEFQRHPDFVPGAVAATTAPLGPHVDRDDVLTRLTPLQLLVVVPIWRESRDLDLGLLGSNPAGSADAPLGYVVLNYSLSDLLGELKERILACLVVTAAVILVGGALTTVGARHVLRPLRNLVETTTAIAAGARHERATEHAVGEIGTLARSFNHMADSLEQTYASIEHTVAERTAELEARRRELEAEIQERRRAEDALRASEACLRQAKDAAEAANSAKSDFLANMSHELRTPLTAIVGFSELLCQPDDGRENRHDWARAVHGNARHLLALICDVLDLAKIEARKLEIEHLPCSPQAIIEEVASTMRARALAKGLAFDVQYIGPVPAKISTDPTRFRQLLTNLVGNAVKFTKAGEISVRVALVQRPSGQRLEVSVRDTGIGIPARKLDAIFDPFSQADTSVTRQYGGTGLGLAISRHLAEALGGAITVQSTPGSGSLFTAEIDPGPVDLDALHTAPESAADATADAPDGTARLEARILLVEDGPDNRKLISLLLRRAGASVELAENGQQGVERALGERFDLVLMDMQMPVMDGYTAARTLRARGCTLPIIALTAHAMSGDADKCMAAGCSGYVPKPVTPAKLIRAVSAALCGEADAVASSTPYAPTEPVN